jgi:putative ABC transport system permease protein
MDLSSIQIGLAQGAILGWAVLCFSVAYRLLGFADLTVEGSLAFGAGAYAMLLRLGAPLPVCVFIALIAGSAAGALTGIIHAYFKVNQFLAGIIVVAISFSATLRVMKGPNLSLITQPGLLLRFGVSDSSVRQSLALLLVLFCGSGLLICLFRSKLGIALRAVGANHRLADELGLRSQLLIVGGLAFCNLLAALSGVLLADTQGFADVSNGQGVLIISLAALTIGEKLTPSTRFSYPMFVIIAAVVGSITYEVIVAIALRLGLPAADLRLATGLLVLAIVATRMRSGSDPVLGASL